MFLFYRSLNLYLSLPIGKMNSNRFISRLMDQKRIGGIRISALTFISSTAGTSDLIFLYLYVISWNFELRRVLPEFCIIDTDVFFL